MTRGYKKVLCLLLALALVAGLALSTLPVNAADPTGNEIIPKRTRNSKTFDLGNGRYSLDVSIGAIHYDDGNGWQGIDNELVPGSAPWDWVMVEAGYRIGVLEDFTAGQILQFWKRGSYVNLQPMALEWTNDLDQIQQVSMPQSVSPVITNPVVDLLPAVGMPSHQGTIRWGDAYGEGLDFEWRCSATRLLKTLTISGLDNLPPPYQYIQDGGNPVLRLNLIFDPSSDVDIYVNDQLWGRSGKAQTFDAIEFRKDGEVLWGFMPLRYWDSSEGGNGGQSVATLERRGNKLYISIRVPYEWLQNAVYPVFIDTDVDEQVGATADDGRRYTGSLGFSTTDTSQFTGYYNSSSFYHCHYFARWTGITLEGTIGTSYISIYGRDTPYGTPELKVYGVDEDNPVAPTSAAEFDADPLTSAAVDWDGSWSKDNWHNSPSLNAIFQELVDSYAISGDAIMIQIKNDGGTTNRYNYPADYSYNTALAAKLHIEYSEEAAPPDPPTNFTATDDLNDKVTCTWTKSDGATKYEVFRDGGGLGELGDVATYDDTGADAPTITAGTTVATDGSQTARVALSLSGTSANNGATHTYTVKAGNENGWSDASDSDTGHRCVGSLSYQWQRSSGDSDADYSNIDGATSSTYNDTAAPAGTISNAGIVTASDGTSTSYVTLSLADEATTDGAGRYYRCVLNAAGASSQTSASDRGYRGVGAITYQWQVDDGGGFDNIAGGTTDPYNYTGAPAGKITNAGTVTASDGTQAAHVVLLLVGETIADGATYNYQCIVSSAGASNSPQTSNSNTGYRKVDPITYQWQMSDDDSDANYNTDLGTTDPYNATEAPANGDGRWFRCVVSASGASNSPQTSAGNRGYRATDPTSLVSTMSHWIPQAFALSGIAIAFMLRANIIVAVTTLFITAVGTPILAALVR